MPDTPNLPVEQKATKFGWPEPQSFIAVFLIVSVVAIVFTLIFVGKVDSQMVTMMVGGIMTVGFASIINFFYGSSKSSKTKDDTISTLAGNPAPAGSPTAASIVAATDVAKVASVLALCVSVGAFAFGPTPAAAAAATTPKSKAGQITATQVQQNPLLLLQTFTVTDLQAALADANAQTPPDIDAAACYTALLPIIQSNLANPLPAGPGVFQALQKARDAKAFIANLQSPTGPLSALNRACAPLVMDVNATLLALGVSTGIVAGTGGLAIPALPGLSGLLAILPK
jgi:hypothetical protein